MSFKRTRFNGKTLREVPGTRNRPGRKGVYNDQCPERAYRFALLGFTNMQLADVFQISIQGLEGWLVHHPEFREAVERGREEADTHVVKTLLQRALGFEYTEEILFEGVNAKGESYSYTRQVKKRVLPDVSALIYWLKVRQKERWSEVTRIQAESTINFNISRRADILKDLSNDELKTLLELGVKFSIPEMQQRLNVLARDN